MNDPTLIHAFVDGELSAAEREQFEIQLQADPELAREVESARQLKACIGKFAATIECAEAWRGCTDRIAELEKSRRTERFVTRNAWALSAAFALVILVGGLWHRMTTPSSVENADFVKIMAGGIGVTSKPVTAERKELNRYLDALLNDAKEASTSGRIMVLRAGEGEMGGHRVTRLDLQDGRGFMVLLVTDGVVNVEGLNAEPESPGFGFGLMGSANCVSWNAAGHTFLLVGDRNQADLVVSAKSISRSGS